LITNTLKNVTEHYSTWNAHLVRMVCTPIMEKRASVRIVVSVERVRRKLRS